VFLLSDTLSLNTSFVNSRSELALKVKVIAAVQPLLRSAFAGRRCVEAGRADRICLVNSGLNRRLNGNAGREKRQ
jgi:hypothetical protein